MKIFLFYLLICVLTCFCWKQSDAQTVIAFQGAESGDSWGYTSSGAGTEAPAEAFSAPNIVSGTASLVAGGNTGGGSCFAGGSGNGPSTARSFTFDQIDISGSNAFTRTLTFHWGNRFPVCNGTGWDTGEDLIFEAFHDGVSQGVVTIVSGSGNAAFSIQSNVFSWDIPACVSQFSFTVSVTTNRRDELLFLDDVTLTTPGLNTPLPQPSAIAGTDTLCIGSQEIYSVVQEAGISYTWTNLPAGASFTTPNGGTDSDSITVDWGTTPAGTYTLMVSPSNSCGNTGPASELNITLLDAFLPAISGPATLCEGDSIQLTSNSPSGNLWSTGETSASITISTPGTYSLSIQTPCGTVSTSKTITGSPAPVAQITPDGPTTLCSGESVTLSAGGSTNPVWSTGSTDTSINVSTPGTYVLRVTNSCGMATDTVTVSIATVDALFSILPASGNAPLYVQFNNESAPENATFSWDFGNGETSAEVNPAMTYTVPGNYTVTLIAANATGCTDSFSLSIAVADNLSSVEIPNVFSPNGDQVNDLFEVHTESLESYYLAIFNRWGNLLKETNDPSDHWDGRDASGNDASAGTYVYKLQATGKDGEQYDKSGFITLVR